MKFNAAFATALCDYAEKVRSSPRILNEFKSKPTESVIAFLKEKGIEVPEEFHAHAVHRNNPLPEEPWLAKCDRHIYICRENGLFEFKFVPGSPEGDDSILNGSRGACACCNCGCIVVS